jgi:hypothetical protein
MVARRLLSLLGAALLLLSGGWRAAAQNSNPDNGVVLIELPEGKGRGAGIILAVRKAGNENEVLILTAYHVVQKYLDKDLEEAPVRFYGDPTPAKAKIIEDWIDKDEGLAVIRVVGQNVPGTIRALPFGNIDSIGINSPVTAIGHRVDGGNETWLPDHGLVAQPVGPRITFSRVTADSGFSGGPLLDSNGGVVGIVEEVSGGLGYAKNVNLIRVFLQGLRDKGVVLEVGPTPPNPDKAHVEEELRRIFDGTGTSRWSYPDRRGADGHMWISGGEETRKFLGLEKCALSFESSAERWSKWGDADGPPEGEGGWNHRVTVTIDLSDVTVQVKPCCESSDSIIPKYYPKGALLVVISGTPGFKPISEEGSSILKRTNEETQIKESWAGWNLYYETKEAADVAVTALDKAIRLCKLGH